MGNNQSWDKPNGFHLRRREDKEFYEPRNDVEVFECIRWLEDMDMFVDKLISYNVTKVIIVGHSYGIGRGAVALVEAIQKSNKDKLQMWERQNKALAKRRAKQGKSPVEIPKPRPITVLAVIGNDGVKRGIQPVGESLLIKILSFRSIIPAGKIRFPANSVQKLYGQRQSNRIPKGHKWKMGNVEFDPAIENIDLDGWKLVHHDADRKKKERDFDESKVSRQLELEVFRTLIV